ncbi:MAG: hypothetical protein A3K03_08380 [Bdellovibrionales bacterium RIFOXYD1_FULL_44_7]|nr:MAG: hypothetical protein A3K03_08380 [Bdellovibrionales bacterium RIFOXYD1_FULL_44_7]
MTQDLFPLSTRVLETGLAEGVAPGFVAAYWDSSYPNKAFIAAKGYRRAIPSPLPVFADTVFDLASVTKVFTTATLITRLIEKKWLSWNTSLKSVLCDYPYPEIQIKHLLSHTSGLPAWHPFWEKIRATFNDKDKTVLFKVPIEERQKEMKRLVFSIAPEYKPGEKVIYSDLGFILLGFVIEEIVSLSFDQAVRIHLWQPLGINNAFFNRVDRSVEKGAIESAAATEVCPWRGGVLQGQVHDDNCWAMGGYAGHAGAFATASDLIYFSRELVSGFLSFETLSLISKRLKEPKGCERTLGWDTPSGPTPAFGKGFSPNSFGHTGFTGTSLWIDPDNGIVVALLSNRVHPTRENPKIKTFRSNFHQALSQDLKR